MSSTLNVASIERPDPKLMQYYVVLSLISGPAFPFVLLAQWMRYITLRYKFDDHGVSMSYGVFVRREVNLTYRRLQDIHLTRNLLQRWMGLATISLQTASGNAGAEMSIEGILEADALRDYLYSKMRGARDEVQAGIITAAVLPDSDYTLDAKPAMDSASANTSTMQTLLEIRDAMQRIADRKGGI